MNSVGRKQPRTLLEVHVVCRGELGVQRLHEGTFISGIWAINPDRIQEGVTVFALHENRAAPSYLQGKVIRVANIIRRPSESGKNMRRIEVLVEASSQPLDWRGEGKGEKGYLWAT